MRNVLPIVLIAGLMSACVFKGKHERLQVQLDATQMAMSARAERCQTDIQTLEARVHDLDQEISLRQQQLDELGVRTALRDEELAKLQEERVALAVLLENTLEENRSLKTQLESLRRRRRKPVERPTDPDGPPQDPGRVALSDIQEKLEEDFQEQLAQQFLDSAHEKALEVFAPLVEARLVEILRVDGATVLRIPTGKLFQEGQTVLSPRGQKIVSDVAAGLERIPGRDVSIEAHTDEEPVHSAQFPSNWEKGFGRAAVVLHALEAQNVHARLSATSFAGTRPLVRGGGEVNRRVELVITIDPSIADRFEPAPGPRGEARQDAEPSPTDPAPE